MLKRKLLSKCTVAYKLVSSLKSIITVCRANNSYPKQSDNFLLFCSYTADETLNFIEQRLVVFDGSEKQYTLLVSQLDSIVQAWRVLHAFIKPTLDADTLKIPYSLVQFLSIHIGSLDVVKGANIVVNLIPNLNYNQNRHTTLNSTMRFLKIGLGHNYTEPRYGFLGLPCSQSKSLFMNCILYHEAGHFIAEETTLFPIKEFDDLVDEFKAPFEKNASWAARTFQRWLEEIFADIVAVKLLGPAYTLAYLELVHLMTDSSKTQIKTFDIFHPADALRLREQVKTLESDGWEKHIDTEQWDRLKEIAAINEDEYRTPNEDKDDEDERDMKKVWTDLITFLCQPNRIKKMHDKADILLKDRQLPCEHYATFKKRILQCLEHGIVPSAGNAGEKIPHPTAIMNGAVFFLISGMKELFKITKNIHENVAGDHALLEQRVEMWCMKAIEDWLITEGNDH